MIVVADHADRRAALQEHQPRLAAGKAHLRILPFLLHQLRAGARAADHLRAAVRLKLDRMDLRADRDVAQLHRVAYLDVSCLARDDLGSDVQPFRRQDVPLVAVSIDDQRDAGGTIRVAQGQVSNDEFIAPYLKQVDLTVLDKWQARG